jgi:hypothetical protein
MAEFTSVAFDEILEISMKQSVSKQDFERIKELSSNILVTEQEKYAWILEGIWINSEGELN